MGTQIRTGIDKLIQVVKDRKNISMTDAAKELGISIMLVEEWANFLEEKNFITIDYKLSGAFMKERDVSKADILKDKKEVKKKSTAIMNEIAKKSKNIERLSSGIEPIKKEFYGFFDTITSDFKHIRKDLEMLKEVDREHARLEHEMIEYEKVFSSDLRNVNSSLRKESSRYAELLANLGAREKDVKEIEEIENLKEREKIVQKNLHSTEDIAKELVSKEGKSKRAGSLQKSIKLLRKSLSEQRDDINSLIEEKDKKRRYISKLSENIAKKIAGSDIENIKNIESNFKDIISKKRLMGKFLATELNDVAALKNNIIQLIEKAKSLNKISGSAELISFSRQIAEAHEELEKKHMKLHSSFHLL